MESRKTVLMNLSAVETQTQNRLVDTVGEEESGMN